MQLTLPNKEKLLTDLFQAYFDARQNKRNTINALAFEKHFESNIFKLYDEIANYNYTPKRSICFIVKKPVKREIFAADFRDRVIHHLIYNYISPIFDKIFINDSYSCRTGKGTHYGIKRIDHFIRSCSQNYSKDCYILKLDIKGYFMAMNKDILKNRIFKTLNAKQHLIDFDLPMVKYLIEQTLFSNPVDNCTVKGNKSDWIGLPKDKSLFYTRPNCGLPIGNLTSQLFGNIYMNEFDHYVKKQFKIKYYGRYVDDFVLIHKSKKYLKSLIPKLSNFLLSTLSLVLHPKKIYLQHFSKGIKYLGAVIKPHRIYISNRTKGNFHRAITKQNEFIMENFPTNCDFENFRSSLNSYLGILKHYKTNNIRREFIGNYLSNKWWRFVYFTGHLNKLVLKDKYDIKHNFI